MLTKSEAPANGTETKQAKFTPGPWLRDKLSGLECDVRAASGRKVALCWGLSRSKGAVNNSPAYREECDANARLIAAAPDLLDSAKDGEDAIASLIERFASMPEGTSAHEAFDSFYSENLKDALAALRAAIARAEG